MLYPMVDGWSLSSANPSRPVDNFNYLVGVIDHDITDLRIVFENGDNNDPFAKAQEPPPSKLELYPSGSALKAPLQGAADTSIGIEVIGTPRPARHRHGQSRRVRWSVLRCSSNRPG